METSVTRLASLGWDSAASFTLWGMTADQVLDIRFLNVPQIVFKSRVRSGVYQIGHQLLDIYIYIYTDTYDSVIYSQFTHAG